MITDYTEYHRLYYYKRRAKMIAYFGVACAHCGSTDQLEFDHIDPALKSFNINENMTLSNPGVRAELDKCQLLCRPCHEAKTAAEHREAGFTHGSMYGWQKARCACADCSTAKRAWYDARNERLRADHPRGNSRGPRLPYGRKASCGEYISYSRGCRCSECRAANATYTRELKARKAVA